MSLVQLTTESNYQRLTIGSLFLDVLTVTWVSTLSWQFLALLLAAEVLRSALCLGVLSLLVFWPDLLIIFY